MVKMSSRPSTFRVTKNHLDALDMRRNTSIKSKPREGMPKVGYNRVNYRVGNSNPL